MGMGITHTLGLWTHSTGVATKWLMGVTCRPQSCVRFNKQDYWFVFCQSQCATTTLLFVVEVVGLSFPDLQGISLTITLQDFLFWFAFLTSIIFYFFIFIVANTVLHVHVLTFFLSLIPWESTSQKIFYWKGLKIRTPFMASHFRISNWKQVGHVMHS